MGRNFQTLTRLFFCSRQSWRPMSMWSHSIVELSPSEWDAAFICWPDPFCSRRRWGPMPKDLTQWATTCGQKGCGKWGWAKVKAKHLGPRPHKAARPRWQASHGNATTTATRKRNWGGCTQSMTDIDWFQPQGWRVDSRKELGWADYRTWSGIRWDGGYNPGLSSQFSLCYFPFSRWWTECLVFQMKKCVGPAAVENWKQRMFVLTWEISNFPTWVWWNCCSGHRDAFPVISQTISLIKVKKKKKKKKIPPWTEKWAPYNPCHALCKMYICIYMITSRN